MSVDTVDKYNNTSLMYAEEENYEDKVNLLLEKGADTEAKNSDGNTALELAKKYNNTKIVKSIDEEGVSANSLFCKK